MRLYLDSSVGTQVTDILNLKGLKAVRVVEEGDGYVIEAESTGVVTACPDCAPGLGRLYGHGSEQ